MREKDLRRIQLNDPSPGAGIREERVHVKSNLAFQWHGWEPFSQMSCLKGLENMQVCPLYETRMFGNGHDRPPKMRLPVPKGTRIPELLDSKCCSQCHESSCGAQIGSGHKRSPSTFFPRRERGSASTSVFSCSITARNHRGLHESVRKVDSDGRAQEIQVRSSGKCSCPF